MNFSEEKAFKERLIQLYPISYLMNYIHGRDEVVITTAQLKIQ